MKKATVFRNIGHLLVIGSTISAVVHVALHGPTAFGAIAWPIIYLVSYLLYWFMTARILKLYGGKTPAVRKFTREEVDEASQNLSENLAGVGELRDRIDESAQGYRRKLESMGYSPTIAEQLAAQYHSQLIATLRGSTS